MNPDLANEFIRATQENSWVYGTIINVEIFVLQHLLLFLILSLAYAVFWLYLVSDDLKHETGVDRLTWLVVLLSVPLFGSLFYLRRLLEREAAALPASSKPGWRRSID